MIYFSKENNGNVFIYESITNKILHSLSPNQNVEIDVSNANNIIIKSALANKEDRGIIINYKEIDDSSPAINNISREETIFALATFFFFEDVAQNNYDESSFIKTFFSSVNQDANTIDIKFPKLIINGDIDIELYTIGGGMDGSLFKKFTVNYEWIQNGFVLPYLGFVKNIATNKKVSSDIVSHCFIENIKQEPNGFFISVGCRGDVFNTNVKIIVKHTKAYPEGIKSLYDSVSITSPYFSLQLYENYETKPFLKPYNLADNYKNVVINEDKELVEIAPSTTLIPFFKQILKSVGTGEDCFFFNRIPTPSIGDTITDYPVTFYEYQKFDEILTYFIENNYNQYNVLFHNGVAGSYRKFVNYSGTCHKTGFSLVILRGKKNYTIPFQLEGIEVIAEIPLDTHQHNIDLTLYGLPLIGHDEVIFVTYKSPLLGSGLEDYFWFNGTFAIL
jgi:hypothetical protein